MPTSSRYRHCDLSLEDAERLMTYQIRYRQQEAEQAAQAAIEQQPAEQEAMPPVDDRPLSNWATDLLRPMQRPATPCPTPSQEAVSNPEADVITQNDRQEFNAWRLRSLNHQSMPQPATPNPANSQSAILQEAVPEPEVNAQRWYGCPTDFADDEQTDEQTDEPTVEQTDESTDESNVCNHCSSNLNLIAQGPRRRRLVNLPDGTSAYYCSHCASNLTTVCTSCNNVTLSTGMRQNPYNERICTRCFERTCVVCSDCGGIAFQNHVRWLGEEALCQNCSSNMEEWDIGKFECENPTFDCIRTKRQFGVEIETSHCANHWELFNCTIWGCTYDCSIGGKEFISPPLIGDQGLDEVARFCDDMQKRDWLVDERCGLHIHFDMVDLTDEQLFSIAYAYRLTWRMWKRFVSPQRGGNDMCGSPRYTTEEVRNAKDWEYFVGARDRFEYVNWRAFFKHGTFEIRIGEPTLDGLEIALWLVTHATFLEKVKDLTYEQIDLAFGDGESFTRSFSFCARFVWNDDEIVSYLRKLSQRFHNQNIQIRTSYPEHRNFEELA